MAITRSLRVISNNIGYHTHLPELREELLDAPLIDLHD